MQLSIFTYLYFRSAKRWASDSGWVVNGRQLQKQRDNSHAQSLVKLLQANILSKFPDYTEYPQQPKSPNGSLHFPNNDELNKSSRHHNCYNIINKPCILQGGHKIIAYHNSQWKYNAYHKWYCIPLCQKHHNILWIHY